jgi:hypothetical protein
MKLCILGYGRIWTARPPGRRPAAAYFNTTGVLVDGRPRPRSCMYGYVRIDECLGFHPDHAHRTIHRVFETDGVSKWNGCRKVFLQTLHARGTPPDRYLLRICPFEVGYINRASSWLCETGDVISFSEGNDQQEALVILPAFGWVRSNGGLFYLIPHAGRPWLAEFRREGR